MRPPGKAIGYVLKAFPVVSETFILNEIRALERLGVPLVLFSLQRVPQPLVNGKVGQLESPLLYAPTTRLTRLPALAVAHLGLLIHRPRRYCGLVRRQLASSLGRCLARPDRQRRRAFVKRLRRLAWAGWIAAEARRRGIRHLHAHYCGEPLRVAYLVRKLSGIGYSFTAHAKDLYTAPEDRLGRQLERARFAVTCHRHGESTLRRVGGAGAADRVIRVAHGLDTGLFSSRRREREPGLVLAVGRLTEKKGFDLLVRACARLAAAGREFRCEIRGEGALKGELTALAARLGVADRVRIRRFLPHESLAGLYRRAAVFTLPCRVLADGNRDGIPNVVLEAMACGAPVVAARAAGVPEVVRHGRSGLLVPPGDPRALAAALDRVLGDPALAARLGRAAAAEAAVLDYRRTNVALARRFRRFLGAGARKSLNRVERQAWAEGGVADKARRRLGIQPRRQPAVEAAIRRAVTPGVAANAWRPDLEWLATRRLWDEVFKATRLPRVRAALNGSGELDGRVLDLGSGRGGLAVAMRAHGHRVVALDLRLRNCAVAGWRGRRYGLKVPAVASVGERLPFPDASFPAICCLEVLEHVHDPEALLSEIRRVLTPDGACVLTVINRWAHQDPHYHLWGINFLPRRWANRYIDLRRRTKRSYKDCQTLDEMHYYSYRSFRRLAAAHGFRLEDPERPAERLPRAVHAARRWASLGFNSSLVVLRPAGSPAVAYANASGSIPAASAWPASRSS